MAYGHQICTAGSYDVDAQTDTFTPGLTHFPGSLGQNVKSYFWATMVAQIVTLADRPLWLQKIGQTGGESVGAPMVREIMHM